MSMPREHDGLHANALGWNTNTGMSAINLALIFGAKVVYLLGFDMSLSENGKSNWHDDVINPQQVLPASYAKFFSAWPPLLRDLKTKFSGQQLINVSDRTALRDVHGIETVGTKDFWKGKRDGMAS
jgi:hypothetical protein